MNIFSDLLNKNLLSKTISEYIFKTWQRLFEQNSLAFICDSRERQILKGKPHTECIQICMPLTWALLVLLSKYTCQKEFYWGLQANGNAIGRSDKCVSSILFALTQFIHRFQLQYLQWPRSVICRILFSSLTSVVNTLNIYIANLTVIR